MVSVDRSGSFFFYLPGCQRVVIRRCVLQMSTLDQAKLDVILSLYLRELLGQVSLFSEDGDYMRVLFDILNPRK